jgi:hypothetical protein
MNLTLEIYFNQNFKIKSDGMQLFVYIKENKQTETERGVEKINYNASLQKLNSRILTAEGSDIPNTLERV